MNAFDYLRTQTQRVAYQELMEFPLSNAVVELQNEFPNLEFDGITGPAVEAREVVAKIAISNKDNIATVYIVFKPTMAKYGVGVKQLNGLTALKPANTPAEAKEIAKEFLRQKLTSW